MCLVQETEDGTIRVRASAALSPNGRWHWRIPCVKKGRGAFLDPITALRAAAKELHCTISLDSKVLDEFEAVKKQLTHLSEEERAELLRKLS